MKQTKIPITSQYIFHPTRKWRLDFAFPDIKLGIEIQGYGKGHASYTSMAADHKKHNAAVEYDWEILYYMSYQLTPDKIKDTIAQVIYIVEKKKGIVSTPPPTKITVQEMFRRLHNGER